ncbi:CPBP family intramembrane glutamic endopeptidase [Terriglobus aquaticus]|uniref:CPBP family intramembrane glutamic endopeptidase n=1 Tax=Terriglobus aquaticus TaxID=940139 RepID=A0ABW9KHZ0_9BACT|nr:CPBP family intramembrane glutamic endopeptidase [Terriglobus aquaticus]
MAPDQQTISDAGQDSRDDALIPSAKGNAGPNRRPLQPMLGVLLFMSMVAGVAAILNTILKHYIPSQPAFRVVPLANSFLQSAALGIAVAAATSTLAWAERRTLASYGLISKHPVRNLLGGALAGVALLSAVVLLLHQLDLLVFRGQVLFGAAAEWKLAVRSAVFFGVAAFAEEGLVRGYLQYALTRAFSRFFRRILSPEGSARARVAPAFWTSTLLLSSLFAILQQVYTARSHLVLLNSFLFGLLMAFSLWRTGSLWWALGFHTAWDWAQSFLWGVPNSGVRMPDHLFLTEATGSALRSGGSIGPEGSAYTAGALAAGVAILMLLHRNRVYPDLWNGHESGDA